MKTLNKNEVMNYCRKLAGVDERVHEHPSNIHVFAIVNKKFAYFKTSEPEKWRFSVRVSPDRYLELTEQPGIKPARYMHRFHWITILKVSSMPKEYLTELIDWSYQKAFSSLPKKTQKGVVDKKNA